MGVIAQPVIQRASATAALAHAAQQAAGEGGGQGAESRVARSGCLRRLDPDQRGRVVHHVRGRHERVEGEVVGAALRLVPMLLAREEPQPAPGGPRAARGLVSSAEQRGLSLEGPSCLP